MFPMISALKRHKTTVILVALEIALTCAIVTNALFLIGDRLAFMHMNTGVADDQLVWAETNHLDLGKDSNKHVDTQAADLAALRTMPSVQSVAVTNSLPLVGSYASTAVFRRAGDKSSSLDNVVVWVASTGLLKTLGVKLAEGRDFRSDEYGDYELFGDKPPPQAAIITRSLANQLWPGEDPLGKRIYLGDKGKYVSYVVGVATHLLNPSINKYQGIDRNLILPVKKVINGNIKYVLRVQPDRRQAVAHKIPSLLRGIDPSRSVKAHVYTDTIAKYFHSDRAMVWLLVVVIGCLLALAALGVVGLSSFWVQSRTKTIGIRRAIGATRRDILHYFLAENFLIVGLGVVVGCAGAVGLNLWLMHHYELHRMPLTWLPAGALVLWLLGQLAVLGPALRASRVPPVVATRTV